MTAGRRKVVVSAIAAFVVALSLVAYALIRNGNHGPSRATTPGASPSVSDSPSPKPSAGKKPRASASPVPAESHQALTILTGPGDGKITADELNVSSLDVPLWGDTGEKCLSGRLDPGAFWVSQVVHTNLDDGPELETAAMVNCQWAGVTYQQQVVAFDRDAAGKIVTLGQITACTMNSQWLSDVKARPSGGVAVTVLEIKPGPYFDTIPQQREYAFKDGWFRQVGGPTSFGEQAGAEDIDVTMSPLRLGPAGADGLRRGSMTVSLRNTSDLESGRVVFQPGGFGFLEIKSDPAWSAKGIMPIPAGQDVTIRVEVTTRGTPLPSPLPTILASVQVFPREIGPERRFIRFRLEEKAPQQVTVILE